MRPPWFAALEEEDQTFFANPTRAVYPAPGWRVLEQPLEFRAAVVLRCEYATSYTVEPQGLFVPWEQCGKVARPTPDGGHLCDTHYGLWHLCCWCEGPLPVPAEHPQGTFCSPTCEAMSAAEGASWEDADFGAEEEL
jgi:hypothetical protein